MSFFYQKVAYIGLYDENQRIKNIGFVKLRVDDNACKIEIQINGLFPTDTFVCNAYSGATDRKLDEISVKNGKAFYTNTFPTQKIGKSKISFDEFESITIQFPGGKKGIATWKIGKEKEIQAARIKEEVYSSAREVKPNDNIMEDKPRKEFIKRKTEYCNKIVTEEINSFDRLKTEEIELTALHKIDENTIQMTHSYYNKWQQLLQMYPNIKPFLSPHEGEYLSIAPKDFVILNEAHQPLVNNSFLLHGYYNYRHLLLGRRIEREKELYYIGVPGNFYKREKMVAVMFGFEAFEPTSQEEEEVTQGTFGYYLKEVTI